MRIGGPTGRAIGSGEMCCELLESELMPRVLVVEDSEQEVPKLRQFLAQAGYDGLPVTFAMDLCDRAKRSAASAVLVGSVPVELDVPTFFAAMNEWLPTVPIMALTGNVTTTAVATEQAASTARHRHITPKDALSSGIAGCLPRDSLASDLEWTLQTILSSALSLASALSPAQDDSDTTSEADAICYTIDNAPGLIPLLVAQARCRVESWPFADPMEPARVAVALSEVLENALYHGNLELSSELRQGDGRAWREESRRRLCLPPYCDRRIRFQGVIDHRSARFTIHDEGPGFNPHLQTDCTERKNLERCAGRGLFLMRAYMDEVQFNAAGNEAVLVKHRP